MNSIFNMELNYTNNQQILMNYILQNPGEVCLMSITELASHLDISESTISRFCRHTGYEDYKNLKKALRDSVSLASPASKLALTLTTKTNEDMVDLFFEKQIHTLLETQKTLNREHLEQTIDALLKADTIYIHGKGASAPLASMLQFRLNRFFPHTKLLPTGGSELFESLVHVTKEDLILTFGFQKLPVEGQVLLDYARSVACTSVLFTGNLYSIPEHRADLNLYVFRGDPQEYHSMTSAMMMLDLLVILLGSRLEKDGIDHLQQLHQLKETYKSMVPR